MTAFTTEQIEARALALFQERKANFARRDPLSAEMMVFDGTERAFCLEAAAHRLAEEAYDAAKAEAEIARWVRVSTPALKAMIAQLEAERSTTFYRLATHTAIQDRDLDELHRMRAEYTRRSTVTLEQATASFCDMLTAPYRTPVRGADLSPAVAAE